MENDYQELKDQLLKIQEQNNEILKAIHDKLELKTVVTGEQIRFMLSGKDGTGIETSSIDNNNEKRKI